MPHTDSARKALRKTERRNERNRAAKKDFKLALKKFLRILETGTVEEKQTELRLITKKVDKLGAKGIIHRNTSDRRKGQYARMVNEANVAPAAPVGK